MKNILSFTLFYFLTGLLLSAQSYNNLYVLADDPMGDINSDQASMVIDPDGSTVTVHNVTELFATNVGAHNAHILKVDAAGQIIWSKQYGGAEYDDQGFGITQTDDGGYIVVGSRGKIKGSYRSWIFKIDANGNTVWDRLSVQQSYNVENLMVTRTSESAENYLVVGHTFPNDRVTAMKISGAGQPMWNNLYEEEDLINIEFKDDLPSSIVYDQRNNGYVIAGIEGNNFQEVGKRQGDLFTLGIRLDGTIYSNFIRYDFGILSSETKPHIIKDIQDKGFVMAFGTQGSKLDGVNSASIAVMRLEPNLLPLNVMLYTAKRPNNDRANSIIADPNGFYAMSILSDNNAGLLNGTNESTSFLRIDEADMAPVNYVHYNKGLNAGCTFMAYDAAANNYVIKTNSSVSNHPGIGLIRTTVEGASKCAVKSSLNFAPSTVFTSREKYAPYELNLQGFRFPSFALLSPMAPVDCNNIPAGNRSTPTANTNEVAGNTIKAYPTLLDQNLSSLTLEFSVKNEAATEISIYNTQGALVHMIQHQALRGKNKLDVPTTNLSQGVNTILVRFADGSKMHTRVVKL